MIDPRQIPFVSVGDPLPAVSPAALKPDALRRRFSHVPEWMPEIEFERKFGNREPAHAAVLIAVVTHEEPTVLLTLRANHLATHSGQVAFPGGKVDASDSSPVDTALREAWEEVGLEPDKVELLGALPTYTTGTAFVVTPVVALIQPRLPLSPNPSEVSLLFEVPLRFLMDPANHRMHRHLFEGVQREWYSMPYRDGDQEHFIWGATAGMLRNLYRLLAA